MEQKISTRCFLGIVLLIGFFWFFLLISISAFAQVPNTIVWNLNELVGQENDIRLEGYKPTYVLFLPNFKGVNWNETHLALKIWFSEVLNPESQISLFINDQFVHTKLLKDIQMQPGQVAYLDIPIPEAAIKMNNQLIKIEIQPTLFISNNLCKDIFSGNLWIIIKKESFITFKMKTDWVPQTIDDFLQSIKETITIVLPPQPWSDHILQSYFSLYAFLHKTHREQPFQIQTTIAPSQFTSSDLAKHYQIYLLESSSSDYQMYGKKLFLTFEGIETITARYHKFLIGKSGKIFYSNQEKKLPQINKTTFFDLGYSSFKLIGFGNMEKNLRFYYSDISNQPAPLTLRLFFSHTPLPPDFKGEALIKVSINSQPIYSQLLEAKSGGQLFPIDLSLPFQFLKPMNTLTLGLSYFPGEENYRPGIMPFEGFFSEDSYFQVKSGVHPTILSSWKTITALSGNKIKIVLPSQFDENTLQIAAEILSSIQLYNSSFIPFEIIFGNTDLGNLFTQPKTEFKWNPHYYSEMWNYHWVNFFHIPKTITHALSSSDYLHRSFLQKIPITIYNITLPFGQFVYHLLTSFLSHPIPIQTNQQNNYLIIIISPEMIPNYLLPPVSLESGKMVLKDTIQNKAKLSTSLNEPMSCLVFFYQNQVPVILFTSSGQKSIAADYFKKYFNPKTTFLDISGNFVIFEKNGIIDTTFTNNSQYGNQNKPGGYLYQLISNPNERILFIIILGIIIALVTIFYSQKRTS